jgi:hypothetical protein
MGGVRRVVRESYLVVHTPGGSTSAPVATENWTTQETTAYNSALPADSPGAWGGTLANLDRVFTATGGGHTALGVLLTWVHKPDQIAGVQIKVTPTYLVTEAPVVELWTKKSATWTKRHRVALTALVRSGDSLVLDLTFPALDAADVDAMWVTLVPTATEALTWTVLHCYGVCNNDPITNPCPVGTPPEDCADINCDVDPTNWLCLELPEDPGSTEEPDPDGFDDSPPAGAGFPPDRVPWKPPNQPTPVTDPLLLPPIVVGVPMPTTYYRGSVNFPYLHDCPDPSSIHMTFGVLPGGGSVHVAVLDSGGLTFSATAGGAAVTSQTIAAPGAMEWWVVAGKGFASSSNPTFHDLLPPRSVTPEVTFVFTRRLAGSAWSVAGNMFDILMYFWTVDIGYMVPC